jgi:hypothetical protein
MLILHTTNVSGFKAVMNSTTMLKNSTSVLFMFILVFFFYRFGFLFKVFSFMFMVSLSGRNLQRGDCSFIFS